MLFLIPSLCVCSRQDHPLLLAPCLPTHPWHDLDEAAHVILVLWLVRVPDLGARQPLAAQAAGEPRGKLAVELRGRNANTGQRRTADHLIEHLLRHLVTAHLSLE